MAMGSGGMAGEAASAEVPLGRECECGCTCECGCECDYEFECECGCECGCGCKCGCKCEWDSKCGYGCGCECADGRKSDRHSELKKKREPDSGDFCMLNIAYVVMHTDCAATPRQRQTIEHFRYAGRCKFGTLLEYSVEIFRRNRTLIF